MTQVRIPHGEPIDRGPIWYRWGGQLFIRCAKCNTALALNHDVEPSGRVTPSIVCPIEACDWHVWGTLEDYQED